MLLVKYFPIQPQLKMLVITESSPQKTTGSVILVKTSKMLTYNLNAPLTTINYFLNFS